VGQAAICASRLPSSSRTRGSALAGTGASAEMDLKRHSTQFEYYTKLPDAAWSGFQPPQVKAASLTEVDSSRHCEASLWDEAPIGCFGLMTVYPSG